MGCSFEAARQANQCGNSNNNKHDNNKKEQLTLTIKTTCSTPADITNKLNHKGSSNKQHKHIAYNYNNNKHQQEKNCSNTIDSAQQQQQQETTIESVKTAKQRQRQEEQQQQHLRQRALYNSNSSKRDNNKQKDKHSSSSNKDGSNASNSHNKLLIYDNDSFDKKYLTTTYNSCCRRLESNSKSGSNSSSCCQNCTSNISSNSSNIAYNQFINSSNESITYNKIASNTKVLNRKDGCIDKSNTINNSYRYIKNNNSDNCSTSNGNIKSNIYTNNYSNETSSNIYTNNNITSNIPSSAYTSNNNNCICNKSNICYQQQTQQRTTVALATTTTPQHEQQQCERCSHSNVTTKARQLHGNTTHMDSNNNSQLHEMLLQARATLTTQLASVSNSLYENLSFCSAAADAACVLLKRTKRQQRQLPAHQQHLQSHRRRAQQSEMSRRGCATQQQQQQQLYCQQQRQQQHAPLIDDDSSNNNTSAGCGAFAPISACNYIGHNYYHLLRNSVSLYAASSVILVLCYLTTSTSATPGKEAATIDKHPIQSIDWSKFDESSSDKEILDLLLEKKRYDKRLLPPVNDEDFCCGLSSPDMAKSHNARRLHKRGTLTVNVNVLLLSLASPDESSLKYEVEFLLNQQWNDPRLQYGNKSHYDFLNALHHHDSIWTPDTYFIMHGDFKDPLIPMHFALRIYRNGTITYAMRRHLILSCQGSLHIFPFDDPKCSFSMESISYEEAQIKYVWKNDEATLRKSPSLTTLNAYLIKNQTTPCDQNSWRGNYSCLRVDLIFTRDRAFYFTTVFIPGIILVTSSFITFWLEWNAVPARSMIGNYSCLQVELTFTRDRAYYFTTVFIPGIILVTSSFITFWLEWNAVPARVMIGVTTMLNFFTTSNGFRSTLPVVSNLTAMNVWDGVCMCFIYASLLEFVCVNYVGRKRPLHNVVYRPGENPVTQRLPAVLSRIGVILASPLEIIEREFHAALSSEKAAASDGIPSAAAGSTPYAEQSSTLAATMPMPANARIRWEEQHGGIIGAAVQNLRARYPSVRRQQSDAQNVASAEQAATLEHTYTEPVAVNLAAATLSEPAESATVAQLRRSRSMSTNTPPLIVRGASTRVDIDHDVATTSDEANRHLRSPDIEAAERQLPLRPPRKKNSRSTSPAAQLYELFAPSSSGGALQDCGEKRRDVSAPNEIVACTTCAGSSSPCTHSANNGCATETCFVQVRKKEPPHPIRVAKTIDVIARITFPTAYAIFLIFFFVHYKGFS